MTKTQIINETIAFYNNTNRGYNEVEGVCVYLSPTGNKCAVGRCMTDDAIAKYGEVQASINALLEFAILSNIDDILKPEYHGHGSNFWNDLQRFHDDCPLWGDDGLSGDIPYYIQRHLNMEAEESN